MRWLDALFIGLNMANLAAIGAFALGACSFRRCGRRGWPTCCVGGTISVRDGMHAFLLVSSKSAILIAFKARKFFLKP